jgi:DNA-binding NarL/FixJ family response regulator
MARTTVSDAVVILDDEVYNITWMMDYLYSKNINVMPAASANEALDLIESEIYRAAIIDLNVPILPPLDEAAAQLGSAYITYPGLFVARAARNRGYRGRQVVIYSVHRDPLVAEEARKLGCTYILKGRPKEIKAELDAVISFDPTT